MLRPEGTTETRDEPLTRDTIAARIGIRTSIDGSAATTPPISPSTTYVGESVAAVHEALTPGSAGFAYSRNANPTVVALEEGIASLEGGGETVAFASGMAALHAAVVGSGIAAGDAILASSDLYGVTRSLLSHLATLGISIHYVDVFDARAVAQALEAHRPDLLLVETISNPLLRVAPVRELVEVAHAAGARLLVDNTFATPYLFRPLDHGADIVVHSATKALAGHGDVTAGLVTARSGLARAIRDIRTATGAVLGPFDAWLTMRGIRTLPIRVCRQCASAAALADWLATRDWVNAVFYPGLATSQDHAVAVRQFGGLFGSVLAFALRGEREAALGFMDALTLIIPGTSLGDAESLILYPPLSSHRGLSDDELAERGIVPSLLRLSVGLESVDDLVADLQRAADAISNLAAAPARSRAYNLGTQDDTSSSDGE